MSPLVHGLARHDPFHATAVDFDSTVSGLLYYYVHYYHPSLWPNEMAVLKAGMYTFHEAVRCLLQTVVANKMMMYCLLSAASCRMRYIDRLPSQDVSRQEEHYISSALSLMAQSITHIDLRHALACIVFMVSADSYRSEYAAAKVHLEAAHALLEPLGGITAIDDEFLTGQLAMGDLFLACVRLEPCIFDCGYNPGVADTLHLSEVELSPYQPMVTRFSPKGRLAIPISQLTEAYSIRERLQIAHMSPSRAMQATRWITKRCMAIRHDLLTMRLTGADDALRIALIMWSLLSMNVTGRTKTVKLMAPALKSAIIRTDFWPNLDLKLWILLLGFQCGQEGSTTAKWCVGQLRTLYGPLVAPESSAMSEDRLADLTISMVTFQQGYLYDNVIQWPRTQRLASLLLNT
jgi:hypothetical protein